MMNLLLPLFIGIILGPPAYGMDPDALYPYHLEEVHHAVSGVLSLDTARGSRVRAVLEELVGHGHEEEEGPATQAYLQLHFRRNGRARPLHTTKKTNTLFMTTKQPHQATGQDKTGSSSSEELPPQPTSAELDTFVTQDSSAATDFSLQTTGHTGEPMAQTSDLHLHTHSVHLTHLPHLPHHPAMARAVNLHAVHKRSTSGDVEFNVAESESFYVDPADSFIKVNDTAEISDHESIEFYVFLTNSDGEVVSNPVPFTVHIERPEEDKSYPLGPAVFAGVLCLVIVFLAFFIPFVTRAKRRYKQGKPVFKMGSHPSSVDLESKTSMSRASSEPNWYGNNAYYSYEEEVQHGKNEFSSGIKEYSNAPTLQLSKTRNKVNKDSSSAASASGSSGIDVTSQYAEGTTADEVMSQRM